MIRPVFFLDEPNAKISTNTPVVHGSGTRFSCLISSCPSPEEIEWQKVVMEIYFTVLTLTSLNIMGVMKIQVLPFYVYQKPPLMTNSFIELS